MSQPDEIHTQAKQARLDFPLADCRLICYDAQFLFLFILGGLEMPVGLRSSLAAGII